MSNNDIERARLLEYAARDRRRRPESRGMAGTAAAGWRDGSRPGRQSGTAAAAHRTRAPAQTRADATPRRCRGGSDADRYFAPRRAPAVTARGEARPASVRLRRLDRRGRELRRGGRSGLAGSPAGRIGRGADGGRERQRDGRRRRGRGCGGQRRRCDPSRNRRGSERCGGRGGCGAGGRQRQPGGARFERQRDRRRHGREQPRCSAAVARNPRFVLQRNWAPAGDPAGREVEGDVVWTRAPRPATCGSSACAATTHPVSNTSSGSSTGVATSVIPSMAACSTCAPTATR